MSGRPDLAIMMFDYVPSEVVRNALWIADAAQRSGIQTEVWTAQRVGDMMHNISTGVASRDLGIHLGGSYSRADRKQALADAVAPLAELLAQVKPRITAQHYQARTGAQRLPSDAFARYSKRRSSSRPGNQVASGLIQNHRHFQRNRHCRGRATWPRATGVPMVR